MDSGVDGVSEDQARGQGIRGRKRRPYGRPALEHGDRTCGSGGRLRDTRNHLSQMALIVFAHLVPPIPSQRRRHGSTSDGGRRSVRWPARRPAGGCELPIPDCSCSPARAPLPIFPICGVIPISRFSAGGFVDGFSTASTRTSSSGARCEAPAPQRTNRPAEAAAGHSKTQVSSWRSIPRSCLRKPTSHRSTTPWVSCFDKLMPRAYGLRRQVDTPSAIGGSRPRPSAEAARRSRRGSRG